MSMRTTIQISWDNYSKLTNRTHESVEFIQSFVEIYKDSGSQYDDIVSQYVSGDSEKLKAVTLNNQLAVSFQGLNSAFEKLWRQDLRTLQQAPVLSQGRIASENKRNKAQDQHYLDTNINLFAAMQQSLQSMGR